MLAVLSSSEDSLGGQTIQPFEFIRSLVAESSFEFGPLIICLKIEIYAAAPY